MRRCTGLLPQPRQSAAGFDRIAQNCGVRNTGVSRADNKHSTASEKNWGAHRHSSETLRAQIWKPHHDETGSGYVYTEV